MRRAIRRRELCIGGFETLSFSLSAGILVDDAFVRDDVEAAITTALQAAYAFPERAFGQLAQFGRDYRRDTGCCRGHCRRPRCSLYQMAAAELLNSLLTARTARFDANATATTCGAVLLAQLLLINPNGITLKEMAP